MLIAYTCDQFIQSYGNYLKFFSRKRISRFSHDSPSLQLHFLWVHNDMYNVIQKKGENFYCRHCNFNLVKTFIETDRDGRGRYNCLKPNVKMLYKIWLGKDVCASMYKPLCARNKRFACVMLLYLLLLSCMQHSKHEYLRYRPSDSNLLCTKPWFAVMFIDLRKAFDTVDPKRLVRKLKRLGLSDSASKLMLSYLQNRRTATTICQSSSSFRNINVGVAQGSKLGPLHFIIYINDLLKLHFVSQLVLYADDAALIYSLDSAETIQDAM